MRGLILYPITHLSQCPNPDEHGTEHGNFPDVSREILCYQRDGKAVRFEKETSNMRTPVVWLRGLPLQLL